MNGNQSVKKREDPRIKRTRKLINQAFFELIKEKGFQAITIQDIADRAEVNRATFYAHYEDKYQLLDRYVRDGFREWLDQKSSSNGPFTRERLNGLVTTVFEFLAAMDEQCGSPDKQLEPMFEAAVQEELADFLLTWVLQSRMIAGSLAIQPEPQTLTMLWSWAIFGAGVQWSRGHKPTPAASRAAEVVAALTAPVEISGIAPFRQAVLLQK